MEELRKEKKNRRENWLTKVSLCTDVTHQYGPYVLQGIVVKVVNKSLGEKFYKKKGVVEVGVVSNFDCMTHILAELISH